MKKKDYYNNLSKELKKYSIESQKLEEVKNNLKKLEISNLDSLFSSIIKKDIKYRVNKHSLIVEDIIDDKNTILFKIDFVKESVNKIKDLKIILFETNFKSINFEKIINIGNITQDLLNSKEVIISQINTILKETQENLHKNFLIPLNLIFPNIQKLKEELKGNLVRDIINKLQTTPLILDEKRGYNVIESNDGDVQLNDITSLKVKNFSEDKTLILEVEYISSILNDSFTINYNDTNTFSRHLFKSKSIPWFVEWCGYDKPMPL